MAERIKKEYAMELRKKLIELESAKDEIINLSIKITRISKQIIYAVIREDLDTAREKISEIKENVKILNEKLKHYPMFYSNGQTGLQEYVEAIVFYKFITEGKVPTHKDLEVDEIVYINGLMDVAGEVVRKSIESLTKGRKEFLYTAKSFLEELYTTLLELDIKNYEMRRKIDYVGNMLNKVTELLLSN